MSPAAATTRPRPAIPDVVAEHLEEYGFLSIQRRKLTFSTELAARRLAGHEARLEAHWDALVVNRPESLELARARIGADDPWERAAAIRFWLAFTRPPLDELLALWAETPPDHVPSWREALRGLEPGHVEATFSAARRAALPELPAALLVDALGWHGAWPPEMVEASARDARTPVRSALARHAGHALAERAPAVLRSLLDDAEPGTRRRALWSLALADRRAAVERARALVRGATPEPFALRVLGLLGDPGDHERLTAAAATDAGRPAAFYAFADLGTPEAVTSLIRLLALPDAGLGLAVTEALETAIGPIPREDPDAPATPEEADARWQSVSADLPRDARCLDGRAFPWRGAADETPGAWRWRAAVSGARGSTPALRREVPDGFFEARPAFDARPGE